MLLISEPTTLSDGSITLRLEGQLAGRWVHEVAAACGELAGFDRSVPTRLALDMEFVSFVDHEGIALLRMLAARGVRFSNASLFVTELLKEADYVAR